MEANSNRDKFQGIIPFTIICCTILSFVLFWKLFFVEETMSLFTSDGNSKSGGDMLIKIRIQAGICL